MSIYRATDKEHVIGCRRNTKLTPTTVVWARHMIFVEHWTFRRTAAALNVTTSTIWEATKGYTWHSVYPNKWHWDRNWRHDNRRRRSKTWEICKCAECKSETGSLVRDNRVA